MFSLTISPAVALTLAEQQTADVLRSGRRRRRAARLRQTDPARVAPSAVRRSARRRRLQPHPGH